MAAATTACGGDDSEADGELVDGSDEDENDQDEDDPDNDVGDSMPPDAGPQAGECDPIGQNCPAGQRCTWIWDSRADPSTDVEEPDVGHLGCAFEGTIPENGQCLSSGPTVTPLDPETTEPIACAETSECFPGLTCIDSVCKTEGTGANTPDQCEKGTHCIANICKPICDPDVADSCGANASCGQYQGVFEPIEGMTVAGVCDAKCDGLTQRTLDGLEACNSINPANPNQGCFAAYNGTTGFGFACSRIPLSAKGRTDREPAAGAFINACEGGYLRFWQDATDSTIINCAGTCAPGDADITAPALAAGDTSKVGKLWNQAAPRVGDGVCTPLKKGSVGATHNCQYFWNSNEDSEDNLVDSPLNDSLGVCFPYSDYTYDNDADVTTPEIGYPGCEDLPAPDGDVMSTIHEIFAYQLGCYSWVRSEPLFAAEEMRTQNKATNHATARLKRSRWQLVTSEPGSFVKPHILL